MLVEKRMVIKNKSGLHARPAALFVQIANRYNSDVTVRKGKLEVNGKSIMGILMLAAEKGSTITLKVEGEDAEKTILELERLLSGDMEMPVLEKKR